MKEEIKCAYCDSTDFNEVPFMNAKFKGIRRDCKKCGKQGYTFKPREKELQEKLNEAFKNKREELKGG